VTGRWRKGETELERLLAEKSLERLVGAQADGLPWIDKAQRTLVTAEGIGDGDPESAYVLAYDAARHACAGLLAQQGIRSTSKGGHYAVELAIRCQFGDAFRHFGTLRRRRNELEYPAYPGERVEPEEVEQALGLAQTLVTNADKLIRQLGLF
jgi:hypothetical protein